MFLFNQAMSSNLVRSLPPVVTIDSGETVVFDCPDASNGQANPSSVVGDLRRFVFEQLDPVSGPVFVKEAKPGDVLQIDVLELETADWGWTAALPGFGLLAEEFDAGGLTPALKVWKLDRENGWAWFDEEKGIRIPLRPFCGEMGVARGEKGKFSTIPPYNTGGNIDTRHGEVLDTIQLALRRTDVIHLMSSGRRLNVVSPCGGRGSAFLLWCTFTHPIRPSLVLIPKSPKGWARGSG